MKLYTAVMAAFLGAAVPSAEALEVCYGCEGRPSSETSVSQSVEMWYRQGNVLTPRIVLNQHARFDEYTVRVSPSDTLNTVLTDLFHVGGRPSSRLLLEQNGLEGMKGDDQFGPMDELTYVPEF